MILIVEDEGLVSELWAEALEAAGHESYRVRSAEEALEWIYEHRATLAIVDLGLPGASGLDLIDRLRREYDEAQLPILVASGSFEQGDIDRSFVAGACDYLSKPVSLPELQIKVSKALAHSEACRRMRMAPAALFEPGSVAYGRYRIEDLLGRGSYGVVYRARRIEDQLPVALKVLHSDRQEDHQRFSRECYLLAPLDSPHVVRVLDFGVSQTHEGGGEGKPYMALELVEGPTLAQYINSRGAMDPEEVLAMTAAVASALSVLEARGVVHRDLKPQNLVLRGGDPADAVLIDFGLARHGDDLSLTAEDVVLGTPGYIAPECLEGVSIDGRVDLFALGVISLFAAQGGESFPQMRGMALVKRMSREQLSIPQHLPLTLRRVLSALLQPHRELRPKTARRVLSAIQYLRDRSSADTRSLAC